MITATKTYRRALIALAALAGCQGAAATAPEPAPTPDPRVDELASRVASLEAKLGQQTARADSLEARLAAVADTARGNRTAADNLHHWQGFASDMITANAEAVADYGPTIQLARASHATGAYAIALVHSTATGSTTCAVELPEAGRSELDDAGFIAVEWQQKQGKPADLTIRVGKDGRRHSAYGRDAARNCRHTAAG